MYVYFVNLRDKNDFYYYVHTTRLLQFLIFEKVPVFQGER